MNCEPAWTVLGKVLRRIEAGKSFQSLERAPLLGEYAVLKVSAISWNEFDPSQAKALPPEFVPPAEHIVKKGDFLLSRANTKELVGAAVLVKDDYSKLVLSDKSLRLILDTTVVLPEFVLLGLRLAEARSFIEANATGASSSMRNMSQEKIRRIPIPVPALEVQKRIVEMLNEQMASAKHAADVADAQFGLVARLPRAFLSKRFKSADIAGAPKKRVRDLCRVMSGGTPAKDREDYWGGPIPWITVKDMKTRTVETVNLTITEKAVAETATHLAPAGAVLVLVRGMGLANGLPICEIRRPSAFNQDIKGLISLGEVAPAYLAWGLRAQANEILGDRQTVTHGTLKLATVTLLDVEIPVPPLDIQERVSRQLSDDFVLIDQVTGRLGEIKSGVAELPTTLLRRAFAGAT